MYPEMVETFRPDMGPILVEPHTGKTMPKLLLTLLVAFFIAGPAWPQEVESSSDAAPSATEVTEPAVTEPEPAEEVTEIDDSDLDIQTYEEDDDDFVPSEEIPADVPIPFPSNI